MGIFSYFKKWKEKQEKSDRALKILIKDQKERLDANIRRMHKKSLEVVVLILNSNRSDTEKVKEIRRMVKQGEGLD